MPSQPTVGRGQVRETSAPALAVALRSSVQTLDQLSAYLDERGIDHHAAGIDRLVQPTVLPIRIPRYYLDLIDWLDPGDPLRRQVLPLADEESVLPDDLRDPIGDDDHSPVPGIVH